MKSSNPRWILVALRRGLTWQGRARRAEAWWYMGAFVAALALLLTAQLLFFASTGSENIDTAITLVNVLAAVIAIVPGVSSAIRRLHDLGRSGWWYLLVFATVPLAVPAIDSGFESLSGWTFALAVVVPTFSGGLILLYWFLQRGTIGANQYGPDPLMID